MISSYKLSNKFIIKTSQIPIPNKSNGARTTSSYVMKNVYDIQGMPLKGKADFGHHIFSALALKVNKVFELRISGLARKLCRLRPS
jgi:hypothetical protein